MLPSVLPRLATDSAGRVFPGVWKPLFLKFPSWDGLPFPGRSSLPTSFVSFFVFYIFSYLFLKTMICFSGCLMSSASIQKLFCGVCSALKCSFDASVREKVVSPFYSSAILGLPPFFPFKASQALGVKNSPANAGDVRGTDLIPGLGSSTGGGRENPLQYSFLENPLDRGVYWATVHRVAKSRTQLKRLIIQPFPLIVSGHNQRRRTTSDVE